MRIIQLTAENVKKLKVVDITPPPAESLIEVTGKNGQGKTSVLDSIFWALGGKDGIQDVPIRRGAEEGRIRLDLGDMIVERKFLASGTTTLTVRNPAGSAPGTPDKKLPAWGSPQEMLDALMGRISFDPLAFARKKIREQYDELRTIANLTIDLDVIQAQNDADFKARTVLNRDAKAKRAQLEAFVIPADLPEAPIDETGLLNQIQAAGEHNAAIETRKARREQSQRDANDKKAEGVRLRSKAADHREAGRLRVEDLKKQIAQLEASYASDAEAMDKSANDALAEAAGMEARIDAAEPLPAPMDAVSLRAQLDAAKATNNQIAKRDQRAAIEKEAADLERQAQELTDRMSARENDKSEALAAATFPVEGLSLVAGGVMFKGLPFDQASDSEKLSVGVAIAMAANPKLRVIRIRDGGLLDDDARAVIAKLASERDYQIWMERVDSSGKIGIVMEDGEVKKAQVA